MNSKPYIGSKLGTSKEGRAYHVWLRLENLPESSRVGFVRDNAKLIEKFKGGYVPEQRRTS